MCNKKFKSGTIIKGKDLKGRVLCKVLSEDMNMRGFQYKIGLNEDINPLELEGSCKAGLHFIEINKIITFLDFGTKLAIVKIPDEEDVYVDDDKYRTHRLIIKKVMLLDSRETWKFLVQNKIRIKRNDNYVVR